MEADPSKAYQALVKDVKRGYVLVFDQRLIPFVLNCHVTPQGIVDLDTPHKNPRPIFDSTFRPHPACFAINDWTHKDTEPPIHCTNVEVPFLQWIWNLRISYPSEELYLGDDDVSGAFRWLKYHPNLVAMHTSIQCGLGVFNTGGTFGGNTTPSNWDVLQTARRHLSQWHWLHNTTVLAQGRLLLPPVRLLPPAPTACFAIATPDDLNTGAFDTSGNRLPPPYHCHVDDCGYADVAPFMETTIASSALGLYDVLGYPQPVVPNCLSLDKLNSTYGPTRRFVGRFFDTRRMTIGLLEEKRLFLLQQLGHWKTMSGYLLIDVAEILGILENHTRYVPWVRPWFFSLQNLFREHFLRLFYVIQRRLPAATRHRLLQKVLPPSLWNRIQGLLAQEHARLLWAHKSRISPTPATQALFQRLHHFLSTDSFPWDTPIGLVIPRQPHFHPLGDASNIACGGYCPELQFWFQVNWSHRIRRGLNLPPSSPGSVHINSLEFIAIILQLSAIITAFETGYITTFFPFGPPHLPIIHCQTDNTSAMAWANKFSTTSLQGQRLLCLFSLLVVRYPVGFTSSHIAGINNILSDDISRPTDVSLSLSHRHTQLSSRHPSMMTWNYFQPSPELLLLLGSLVFMPQLPDHLELPRNLGQFGPAASTGLCLSTV